MGGFDGTGTYNRTHDWTTDRDAGTKITASRMDTDMDEMATGLSTCITKDGQTNPTANLKMNSRKHTGVAVGSALTEYADVASVQKSSYLYVLESGAADVYVATLSPTPAAYTSGMTIILKIASGHTNTGASTVNVNSLGAKAIKNPDSTALEAGAIIAGQIVILTYDGTNFQLLSTPSESSISEFAATTEMVFHQASPPTFWTKSSDNDQVLRVVSGGTGGSGSGGSNSIVAGSSTSAGGSSHTHTGPSHTHTGPSHTHTQGATGSTALTVAQLAAHTHTVGFSNSGADASGSGTVTRTSGTTTSSSTGSGAGHTHTNPTTAASGTGASGASGTGASGAESAHTHVVTPAIKYRDVIIAAKD